MRIALLIQYDGSAYHGWQIQPDKPTIQGSLEAALEEVFGYKIGLMGSGRTDSGVHALGQVAHFDVLQTSIPDENIWMTLNKHLPADIVVIASVLVDSDFHSRFMARQREYRYQIMDNYNVLRRKNTWYVRFPLSLKKLDELSRVIIGEHDFSSFCYAGSETENMICTISEAIWEKDGEGILAFRISADRFLHHMVRMLVGSMVEVARGKWEAKRFIDLLEHPDRQNHTVTAAAEGLALIKVSYPEKDQPVWQLSKHSLVAYLPAG